MFTEFSTAVRTSPRAAAQNVALPIAILTVCIAAAWFRLESIDVASLAVALASISPNAWAISLAATIASFLAVARYDTLFHGWLMTGVSTSRAARTGAASIALSQFLGFGLFTGTLCRWRMLPEVSLSKAATITGYVSAAFMLSLGLLILIALIFSDLLQSGAFFLSTLAVASIVSLFYLSLRQPNWFPFAVPPIPLLVGVVATTSIDVAFAGIAFWILLPELDLSFLFIFSVFLLALGTGLMSGTPFGLGPFELCILTLMPQAPTADLLAAILGFRLVFFAIPACVAIIPLACPRAKTVQISDQKYQRNFRLKAEAGFAAVSGAHKIIELGNTTCLTARASQGLVVIGDPICGRMFKTGDFDEFRRIARANGRWPIIYKCTRRIAAVARVAGWAIMAVSEEAWISPEDFNLDMTTRRQLRRKLRQADRARISIELADRLPEDSMDRVARSWSARNGGERSFSMGQYSRQYVSQQAVFLAFQDDTLVAFATFHTATENWTLDILRCQDGTPDGTMHALIVAAIQQAKSAGITRLSLSAMPLENNHRLLSLLSKGSCGTGLRQFKLCFAPHVHTLYAAARSRSALILGGLDISFRILCPDPPADAVSVCREKDQTRRKWSCWRAVRKRIN